LKSDIIKAVSLNEMYFSKGLNVWNTSTAMLTAVAQRSVAHSCSRAFSSKFIKPFAVKVSNIPLGASKDEIFEALKKFKPEGVQILQNGQSALVYFDSSEIPKQVVQELDGKVELAKGVLKVVEQSKKEIRALRWQQRKRDRYVQKEELTSGNTLTEYDKAGDLETMDRIFELSQTDYAETIADFEEFMKKNKDLGMDEMIGAMDEHLAQNQYQRNQLGNTFEGIALPDWKEVQFLALSRRHNDRTREAIHEVQQKLSQLSSSEKVDPKIKEKAENAQHLMAQVNELLVKDSASYKEFASHFPRDIQQASPEHEIWFNRLVPMDPINLEVECSEEEAVKILEEYKASKKYQEPPPHEDEWPDVPKPASLLEPEEKRSIATMGKNNLMEIPGTEGPWAVTIVKEDSTTKVIKGGYLSTNRAVVIIGNLKGMVGYGMGKAAENKDAIDRAIRAASRNLIYVDRFMDTALAQDCYGRHNNCEVKLRATPVGSGMTAGPLIRTILQSAGIADCSGKSIGRRNIFAVIRATFEALESHEGIETIARKRGKRILSMEKARAWGL